MTLKEEINRIKTLFYENFNKNQFDLEGDILQPRGLFVSLNGDDNIGKVGLINFEDSFEIDYDVKRFYDNKEKYCKKECDENFFNKDNSLYLHSLNVNQNQRGKGFGKDLVNKCHEVAKKLGYDYVLLITSCDNEIAQNLYKNLGYDLHQTDGNKDFYFLKV